MSLNIEIYEVQGWEHAIRGMRNPMNSWKKSDSYKVCEIVTGSHENCWECIHAIGLPGNEVACARGNEPEFVAGCEDYYLMMRLGNAGRDHRKFMRMIVVYIDITAPLYWWKEFDTYKVGTTSNSCSTMHKIHEKEFVPTDFSCERLNGRSWPVFKATIDELNYNREKFIETKEKEYWEQMIQLLPSSYNQKRTIMLNYEVLANIYPSRRHHKLDEWHVLCDWIEDLPYSELITGEKNGK